MTDKDNIIENTTSGRKPRRKLKDRTKGQPNFFDIFQTTGEGHLKALFNKEDISMTRKRIEHDNDGTFDLGILDVQWHKVSLFHDAIVPIDTFANSLVSRDYAGGYDVKYLKIVGGLRCEYYFMAPQKTFGDVLVKLSVPKAGKDFRNSSNLAINSFIKDLNEKNGQHNLAMVALDQDNTPRKGLYIPMLRTDNRLDDNLKSKFANVFLMKYDANAEGIDYFHLDSLKNEEEAKAFLKNTLKDWRYKK